MNYTWITVAHVGPDNEPICIAVCDNCGADVTYEAENTEENISDVEYFRIWKDG